MKKNLQQPKVENQSSQNQNCKYFKIFYSKDVNKKKKTFSQGVLAWENKKIRLFNTDGEVLIQVQQKNIPQLNEEYVIGYKFAVFIEAQISKEAFSSGRVFISLVDGTILPNSNTKTNTIKQPNKQLLNKQQKLNPIKVNELTNSNPLQSKGLKETTELQNGLVIENILFDRLREHQIQGVQFMYNCLLGYKSPSICGCILADFMGLGKTLQTITLIYSLLKMKKVSKCIVISPLTLVYVWQKQCKKWLDSKLNPLIALGDGQEVKNICKQFANNQYRMLVLSYQGFYRFIDILERKCDLIVFDQGHRLKNKNSKVYKKILNFSCRKRVLLTGTPLQNNLDELYTCISIVNPSLFASQQLFNNVFQKPILNGMAKKASKIQRKIAIERTIQLANKIKQFSLRRKADTLQKYLPIKRQYFVLFKLTPLQKLWYQRILKRKQAQSEVLSFLNLFRKLFTHPQILKNDRLDKYDTQFAQESMNEVSYKMNFVLDICKKAVQKDEKVIVVSYFTSTLDFISKILKDNQISCIKLDGKVDGKDRQIVVNSFERQKNVLLLSGKAGGTGLTLVSARTMIIIEPDWNPSNDAQVIGRIWRQGQNHQVSIYRLIIISSFEQRIVQRQQLKTALSQKLIDQNKQASIGYDFMDMKKLFVPCSQKSIFFKQSQNIFQKIYSNSGLEWQGVVFVACKASHNKGDGHQGIGIQSKKSLKKEEQDKNNQFADGMLLFEGLIQEAQTDPSQKVIQNLDDEETYTQTIVMKNPELKQNKKVNKQKQQIHKIKNQANKPSNIQTSLPRRIDSRKKDKIKNEIILEKQVQYESFQGVQQCREDEQQIKSKSKRIRLKKYEIVDMADYRRLNFIQNQIDNNNLSIRQQINTDYQQTNQQYINEKDKFNRQQYSNNNGKKINIQDDLDKTISNIKQNYSIYKQDNKSNINNINNNQSSSNIVLSNQLPITNQYHKNQSELQQVQLLNQTTTNSNINSVSTSTISNSIVQDQQNHQKKSKKYNPVLNKIKFNKFNKQ